MLVPMKGQCGREVLVGPSEVDEYKALGYARTDGVADEAPEDPAVVAGRLAYAKAIEDGKSDEEAKAAQHAAQFPESTTDDESEETQDTNTGDRDTTDESDGSEDRG